MRQHLVSSLALAVSALAVAPAAAQTAVPSQARSPYVALGFAVLPDYAGSDDYRAIPFGALSFQIEGIAVRTDGPGLAADLYNDGRLTAGLFTRWSQGRQTDQIDDAVVALLPDVGSSLVTGGQFNYRIARSILQLRDQISIGGRVGVDALGQFDGAAWQGSVSYGAMYGKRTMMSLTAAVSGFSDDYADTLFSVNAADAVASGLPEFSAEGGIQDIGLTAVVNYRLKGPWSATGVFGFTELVGDFANSPIVSVRGDSSQVFSGLAVGRRF